MTHTDCTREPAVVNAVLLGHWPERCDEELIAHALQCEVCREVASLATLIHDDAERSRYETHVPASGQVWWRAAMRARLESTHAATRPITWMHGITAAIVTGVALAAAGAVWPMLAPFAERAWAMVVPLFPNADVASALAWGLQQSATLGLIAAALLVVGPLALYFAVSRE